MGIAHAATPAGHRIVPLTRSGSGDATERPATPGHARKAAPAIRAVATVDTIGGVVAMAVGADDRALLPRIRSSLSREGIAAQVDDGGGAHLRLDRLQRRPDVMVLASRDLDGSLAQAARARRRLRDVHVVLILDGAASPDIRRVLEAGIDGVVLEPDLEATLGLVVRAVCAGHVSLPRAMRHAIDLPSFSHREREILLLVVAGLSNAEIAGRLYLARSTVAGHLGNIFRRLGVHSRADAAKLVLTGDESLRRSILAVEPTPDSTRSGSGRRCP
jgi:DNA-binding NarL/FixJ family response regulator